MNRLVVTVIEAVVAFAATNIDDIFLLMVYFTQVNTTFRKRHIVVGQYLGFIVILAVSGLGFIGALVIPESIIGLLGFAPIYMGLRRLMQGQRENTETEASPTPSPQPVSFWSALFNAQTYSIAVVTIANSGDNISIYIPMFAGKEVPELGIIIVVFGILIALWCYLGFILGSRPTLVNIIRRYGHILIPFVLIALGLYILVESGTLVAIVNLLR